MVYNVERGFHSRDHLLEQHRLEAAQRAVQVVNPDFLAITEACYGGPNSQNRIMNYAQLFGFPYHHFGPFPKFGPRKGDEGGNCLLSRLPMQAETVQLPYKSAIRAKITLENKLLTIDVIHPSPTVTDAEKIKTHRSLITSRQAPYILAGDFNTVSPEDVSSYDFAQLAEDIKAYNPEKAELIIKNWQDAQFVTWLLSQGLKDAFPQEARESTVPTRYTSKREGSGVRMDFIFTSPDITSIDGYVLKTVDTEIASDHYPIVSKFYL